MEKKQREKIYRKAAKVFMEQDFNRGICGVFISDFNPPIDIYASNGLSNFPELTLFNPHTEFDGNEYWWEYGVKFKEYRIIALLLSAEMCKA